MGQIKNIKLHIVTDIKVATSTTPTSQQHHGCVLATSGSQLPSVLTHRCQVCAQLSETSVPNRGCHEEGVRPQSHQVARWEGHQGNRNHILIRLLRHLIWKFCLVSVRTMVGWIVYFQIRCLLYWELLFRGIVG